ncbi:MAG: ATP-binding protein [Armatimonadota bacterium]|nr:MAG: ATP-binding protein [Armatimonadota bacterium]
MKELLVISGKGGTGKTTVVASFAAVAPSKVLADADVDAPNLHLLLDPDQLEERPYCGADLASVDRHACTECDRCTDLCEFEAIRNGVVDARRCEGCGTCALVCPADAITMIPQTTGRVYLSDTRFGPLVHAQLVAGAEASGKLVTQVRQRARAAAEQRHVDLILTDGSPGIGCPVIASLSGIDAALIISEPTPSGLHDLGRVLQVAAHFEVPTAVSVNKCDINFDLTRAIERLSTALGATTMTRIPFDRAVVDATVAATPVVEWSRGDAPKAIRALWEEVASWDALT